MNNTALDALAMILLVSVAFGAFVLLVAISGWFQ